MSFTKAPSSLPLRFRFVSPYQLLLFTRPDTNRQPCQLLCRWQIVIREQQQMFVMTTPLIKEKAHYYFLGGNKGALLFLIKLFRLERQTKFEYTHTHTHTLEYNIFKRIRWCTLLIALLAAADLTSSPATTVARSFAVPSVACTRLRLRLLSTLRSS